MKLVAEVVPPNAPVEIIVVDNGSTDKTVEAFNTARAKFHNLGGTSKMGIISSPCLIDLGSSIGSRDAG